MRNSFNKKILLSIIVIILLVITLFINNKADNKIDSDVNLSKMTHEEKIHMLNQNVDDAPKSYFLVLKKEDVLYEGEMKLKTIDSQKPGEAIATYSGELIETKDEKNVGIKSIYLEIFTKRKEEDLENEIPYKMEFDNLYFTGKLEFSGDLKSKLYRGTLEYNEKETIKNKK